MNKIPKSIRLDPELCSLSDEYIEFLKTTMGVSMTFSEIVTGALAGYLSQKTADYDNFMNSGLIAKQTSSGKLKKLEFTEEQLAFINTLSKKAESLNALIEEKLFND